MRKNVSTGKPFSHAELSAFCTQLSLILHAGLSAYEGVHAMLEDTSGKEEKEILTTLSDSLAMGEDLSASMDCLGLFPSYMIEMVRIGEQTGRLDEVMDLLASHYDREDFIAGSIKNALTYPLAMASIMILVIVVLLVKVLPIFNQVFIQMGSEMTGLSAVLMNIGLTLNRYSVLFILLIVLLLVCLFFFSKTEKGRLSFQKICYRFSFTRAFLEETSACRFASSLALTLGSGLGNEQSLQMVQAATTDSKFSEKISLCMEHLSQGLDLSSSLQKSHIFSGIHSRMITIGEKTGSLEKAMSNVAEKYQEHIDQRINRALAVIEPTLVISISLIVGIILFSVMLPLIGIMSGM